jgi:hypothetical protein
METMDKKTRKKSKIAISKMNRTLGDELNDFIKNSFKNNKTRRTYSMFLRKSVIGKGRKNA